MGARIRAEQEDGVGARIRAEQEGGAGARIRAIQSLRWGVGLLDCPHPDEIVEVLWIT